MSHTGRSRIPPATRVAVAERAHLVEGPERHGFLDADDSALREHDADPLVAIGALVLEVREAEDQVEVIDARRRPLDEAVDPLVEVVDRLIGIGQALEEGRDVEPENVPDGPVGEWAKAGSRSTLRR